MHPPTSDLRIRAIKPLLSPAILEEEIPLDEAGAALITRTRAEIAAILRGSDSRLLVLAGPCSIHDPDSALEYAEKLSVVRKRQAGRLLVLMRVYFEKPRTVLGWRGLISDPGLDGTYRINEGLRLARRLMAELARRGMPVGTEFLDTTLGQYYADLVSWGAIGARTVESQVHRELASGLSMPVGFKNRTDGAVQVAIDAMKAAGNPHWFPSLTREGVAAVLGTRGNDQTHLILRGGSNGPNYEASAVAAAVALLERAELPSHLMVDCSHGNSGKDPKRQVQIVDEIALQIFKGCRSICGVMLESHLKDGAQSPSTRPLIYGRSVTDPCLSWEETEPLLEKLAEAVGRGRGLG